MPRATVSQQAEQIFLGFLEEKLEETSGSKVKDGLPAEVLERGQKWAESKDPLLCLRELYGYRLTRDMRKWVHALYENDQALGIGGHDQGKTFIAGAFCQGWSYYAQGCLPNAEGDDIQGCLLALVANKLEQIKTTSYKALRIHGHRAASRGFEIPGYSRSSDASVLWYQDRERWYVKAEAFQSSAQKSDDGQVSAAAGLKHPNIVGWVEEADRAERETWNTMDGWEVVRLLFGTLNPYNSFGEAYALRDKPEWATVHFSYLRHDSVLARREIVPGAGHKKLERQLRDATKATILGDASTKLDPSKHDFLYALPPKDLPEKEWPLHEVEVNGELYRYARPDGIPGHPEADVVAIRPSSGTIAGRLGEYPPESSMLVFQAAAWRDGVALRRTLAIPDWMPEAVGGDMAEGGPDKIAFTPRWGRSARDIWRRYQAALATGVSYQEAREDALRCDACEGTGEYRDPDTLWCASCHEFEWSKGDPVVPRCPQCQASGSAWLEPVAYTCDCWDGKLYCYLGEPVAFPKTDDMDVLAGQIVREFGATDYNLDQSGGGYPLAPALKRLGCTATLVPFGGAPPERLEGQKDFLMQRDAMYGQLADATLLNAVALPESPAVAKGCRVLEWETVERSVKGSRVDKAKIQGKPEVKAKIGSSPDEADSAALTEAHLREEVRMGVYPGGMVVGG